MKQQNGGGDLHGVVPHIPSDRGTATQYHAKGSLCKGRLCYCCGALSLLPEATRTSRATHRLWRVSDLRYANQQLKPQLVFAKLILCTLMDHSTEITSVQADEC